MINSLFVIKGMENEIASLTASLENQSLSLFQSIEDELNQVMMVRDQLYEKVHALNDKLEMVYSLVDENEAIAMEARQESDSSSHIILILGIHILSYSLGMKDSWGPLKALAAASIINGIGDIILCSYLGYGIAGAAWATLVSQVVAAYMMSQTLNEKGYNAFSFSIYSGKEFLAIFSLSAPVFLSLLLKMGFYALLVYFATSMGAHTTTAHQVSLIPILYFVTIPLLSICTFSEH
ncbi:protein DETOXIFICATION 46, chloroplastic [Trifolium repens]|nr:protein DETOXIFICATION 46, chloroplastic [Trifolium repens]